jgi:hypothetical protein
MKNMLIGIGFASAHATGLEPCFRPGIMNKVSSSGAPLQEYVERAPNGTWVYDASKADTKDFVTFTLGSPMYEPALKPYQVRNLMRDKVCNFFGLIPEECDKDLPTLQTKQVPSGSSVGVDVYIAIMREQVPGVRFGKVQDKRIVWEKE